MKQVTITQLENGNYLVVYGSMQRSYQKLTSVCLYMKEIFEPKPEKRLFHKSGKDA